MQKKLPRYACASLENFVNNFSSICTSKSKFLPFKVGHTDLEIGNLCSEIHPQMNIFHFVLSDFGLAKGGVSKSERALWFCVFVASNACMC